MADPTADDPAVDSLDGVDRGDTVYLSDHEVGLDLEIGTQGRITGFVRQGQDERAETKALFLVDEQPTVGNFRGWVQQTHLVSPANLRVVPDRE